MVTVMAYTNLPIDKRILQVAAEVAEASDDNVQTALIGLKDILDDYPLGSSKATEIRLTLWNYDLIQVTNLILKQKFDDLAIASKLCAILCESCCGLSLQSEPEFATQFLPNATDNVLNIMYQISERHATVNAKEKQQLIEVLRQTSNSLSDLCLCFKFLCFNVLSSNRFLHLLMVEDKDVTLISMALLISIIKANRNSFSELLEGKLLSIVDELVFKLSATPDVLIASTATRVLLFCLDYYPPLLEVLTSKRYKGLHAYLGKWKGKGFGRDIQRLTSILETKSLQQMELQKFAKSAMKIQAAYRGFKTRQQLTKSSKAMTKFQQSYRLRKEREREEESARQLAKTQSEIEQSRRKREFLTSRSKQLKVIEKVPAKTVQHFMLKLQEEAATKIQSSWRGYKSRVRNKSEIDERRKWRAAVRIQKQVRRWMRVRKARRDRMVNDLYPAGLDDVRRSQLQKVICNVREQFPVQPRSLDEVKAQHAKANSMLSAYYSKLAITRRQDSHRYALMAQVTVLSDQLEGIKTLEKLSSERLSSHIGQSTPFVLAAKQQHVDTLKKMQQRWWQKLADEDGDVSLPATPFPGDIATRENQF